MPTINVDVANYGISVFTAFLLIIGLDAERRSNAAQHAKLDELIDTSDAARNDLERIEDEAEDIIEERRK